MRRLTLDHRLLRQFLAVVDAGSVRGGAALLNISQPPLTQTIRRLEEELGVTLFTRAPKGMIPTSAGAFLASEARTLLARLERSERRVRGMEMEPAPLRIGFVSAALNHALPMLLRGLRDEPRPVLQEMTTPDQVSALAVGRLDLGILHPPIVNEDLVLHSLGRDPFVAALPADHRLAGRHSLRFQDVAGQPLVLFPREQGPSLMGAIERLSFEAGIRLDIAATASRVHSQLAIVAGGVGAGLVTRQTAQAIRFRGVSFVPLSDTGDRLFLELAMVATADILNFVRAQLERSTDLHLPDGAPLSD